MQITRQFKKYLLIDDEYSGIGRNLVEIAVPYVPVTLPGIYRPRCSFIPSPYFLYKQYFVPCSSEPTYHHSLRITPLNPASLYPSNMDSPSNNHGVENTQKDLKSSQSLQIPAEVRADVLYSQQCD